MTTETAKFDAAVVGGGITGMCAALALCDRGLKVIVLDSGINAGSAANAGSLHVQLQSRLLRLFPELASNVETSLPLYLRAVDAWHALDKRLGGVELVQNGGLMVAENSEQLAFLHDKAEREHRRGLDVDILDNAGLARIAPWLDQGLAGAELCRNEGKLNPLVANRKLKHLLESSGVEFRQSVVRSVGVRNGSVVIETRERVLAERVIIAAAWGSAAIAESLSAPVPVSAEPLHMNITEPIAAEIGYLVQHAERQITLKQFKSGQLVIGGGWPAKAGTENEIPTVIEHSLCGNLALAAQLVPGIASLRVLRSWAGLNTVADGKTILGPLAGKKQVVAAIPGDAGYTLGPVVGQAAAALAVGDEPEFDPEPYLPSRFT